MDPEALCYGSGSMDVREHRSLLFNPSGIFDDYSCYSITFTMMFNFPPVHIVTSRIPLLCVVRVSQCK